MYCYMVSRELSLFLLVHLDDINFTHCFPYKKNLVNAGMADREDLKENGTLLYSFITIPLIGSILITI